MIYVCIFCKGHFPSDQELVSHHKECKAKAKMSPLGLTLLNATFNLTFCDHYCCGLSEEACMAEHLAWYLTTDEFDHTRVIEALANVPEIRKAVIRSLQPQTPALVIGNTVENLWKKLWKRKKK